MVKSKYRLLPGRPFPLGSCRRDGGVNFALPSSSAKSVVLCLHSKPNAPPKAKIPLLPTLNKTGDVWHIFIEGLPPSQVYSYLVTKHNKQRAYALSDPYCQQLLSHNSWGSHAPSRYRPFSTVNEPCSFDWQGTKPLCRPLHELILYEMHVRGFTQDPSSKAIHPGTFLGVTEKIPYLLELGVNAIELLPVYEFNETEVQKVNPQTGEKLCNFWGYSPVSFFSPMQRYGTKQEFQLMVRELHKAGIEVILDVVYNHTGEGGRGGPFYSFKGLDKESYYLMTPGKHYYNYSGCGNTLNTNHALTRRFIVESLRYWVTEMHVDGFRFDLASIFTRSPDKGKPLNNPPIIEEITFDPILKSTKLIAEAWDAAGLYQVGSFPAHMRWAEWNGKYRDHVRCFIKGSGATAGQFATRISGSEDLYRASGRSPYHSINFITAHDGFTLHDLVSYNEKHNEANGEGNADGCNNNCSWNCGEEGATQSTEILSLRLRQQKNYLLALLLSQGVPMLHMGDEYSHTKQGNNNTYCQDSPLNWLQWAEEERSQELFFFTKSLIAFRHSHKLLQRTHYLSPQDVTWHGASPHQPQWDSSILGMQLHDRENQQDLYSIFNAQNTPLTVEIPTSPEGSTWRLLCYTENRGAEAFFHLNHAPELSETTFQLSSFSALLLQSFKG